MRQNKFISTKDHFILIAASNEVGDELWAGSPGNIENSQTTNTIGFLLSGSVNSFHNVSQTEEEWEHYKSGSSPLMLIRKNFTNLGIVSTSENTLFGAILEKENVMTKQNIELIRQNLSSSELNTLNNNDSVEAQRKCKVYKKRDVSTFDKQYSELDINIISDSDIEIEGA